MKKILLIDTFNFLHRAYHALPKTLTDKEGSPTNAVYGVTSMLINVFGQLKPDYALAALDDVAPTFRVEEFTGYKAHRKPMDEDLSVQIPKVFEIIDAFGVKKEVLIGYEADDIIGTMSERFGGETLDVIIISNDKDLWQLVKPNVMVMNPTTNGQADWLGEKEVITRMGFPPSLIPDYKGLRGDPSDNIPGVYGIGDKTATNLIKEFGGIDEIYQNINKIESMSTRKKLMENYEQAVMSKKLAEIITDAPLDVVLEECRYSTFNIGQVKEVLEKYNFKSLIKRLGFEVSGNKSNRSSKEEVNPNQMSLL
ncbi:5'-3' exonuclease H3TH domain-containing protein [Patescibacteria group bacterium]